MSEKLDEMGKDLGEMIAEINSASSALNKNSKADDPVSFVITREIENILADLGDKKAIASRQNIEQPSDSVTRDRSRYCSIASENSCGAKKQSEHTTVCWFQWADQ